MALLVRCITKCLLYLAHVLNCIFYLELSMCCIAKHLLYLALVLNYVSHLSLLMCCIVKKTLIFGACVQPCLSFRTAVVLHCKKKLYLALVLNFVIYLALWMCTALPHLNALLLIFVLYNVLSAVRCVQWSSLLLLHA